MSAIDDLLARERDTLVRLDAAQAAVDMRAGGLLVDTGPLEQRRRDGEIPGALVIDRNVLEWRLDPTSPHRIAAMRSAEQAVVIVCNEGYSSSLAAATLRRLGVRNATDLDGGFQAWRAAGLPVEPHDDDDNNI